MEVSLGFIETNLNVIQYAASNDLIVLYPQAFNFWHTGQMKKK
jgi:hypothetical protein